MPAFVFLQTSGWLKFFSRSRSPPPILGLRREDTIVGLYGAIYDTLPRHLAEQFKSLDTSYGTRVTLRTGQTFQFRQTPRSVASSHALWKRRAD